MQGYARAGGAVNDYTASNQPMWDVSNTTTWVRRAITRSTSARTTAGGRSRRDTAADLLGDFGNFNILFTGDPFADFLLGYYGGAKVFQPGPFSGTGAVGNPYEFNWMYFAPYIQDDWKVS